MATIKDVFSNLDNELKADPAKFTSEVDGTYKFVLTGDEPGMWVVNCKDAPGVTEGDGEADCIMSLTSEDFIGINDGSLDGMQAFMLGRIQVEGDMGLAMKLQALL